MIKYPDMPPAIPPRPHSHERVISKESGTCSPTTPLFTMIQTAADTTYTAPALYASVPRI